MSGMYEYVGTARTSWVPWLTSERMGDGGMVVWGGGRQRVRRRMEALRRVERMREDAKGSGGVQRSHLFRTHVPFLSTLVISLHATPDGVMGHGDQ